MDRKTPQPRTLTLKEVLEGAERASKRVANWPQWKRDLSPSPAKGQPDKRDAKADKSAG